LNQQPQNTLTPPNVDWQSPEFIANPYPAFHELRAYAPVQQSPFGIYLACGHSEVSLVLRDKRFGRDGVGLMTRAVGSKMMELPVYRTICQWMLMQDPPNHTRLRGLVSQALSARPIDDFRPRIQEIIDQALDRIEPRRHADLIAEFAFRLPATVICELLGVPQEEHEILLGRARDDGRIVDLTPLSQAELDAANERNLEGAAYFQRLFDLRRRQPADDLITRLVQAQEQDNTLSNEELTANIMFLFGAGHETTVNLIGNGLLALFRNPDQLKLLRDDPTLIGNAVEEFLRYDAPVQVAGRVAFEDVEFASASIKRGDVVQCLLGAANRDPAVYAEPDRLDIRRPNVRPISFGIGIHFCLGAQLARLEATLAISTLLRRLPYLTLDDPDHPEWRQTFALRGLNRLNANW
jgi:cytochrome P450